MGAGADRHGTPRLRGSDSSADEAFQIFGQLKRPDGIAIVGRLLGQVLIAAGDIDEARPGARGQPRGRAQAWLGRWAQQIEQLLSALPPDGATDRAEAELRIPSDDPARGTAAGHRASHSSGVRPRDRSHSVARRVEAREPGVLDDLGQFAVAEGGQVPWSRSRADRWPLKWGVVKNGGALVVDEGLLVGL